MESHLQGMNVNHFSPELATGSTGRQTSVQASNARFHNGFPLNVFLSPTMIKAKRARVHITFNLLGSSRNPTSPSTLHRTVENIIMSLSRPWNESIVEQVTEDGNLCRSSWICFVYGERTVIWRSANLSSSGMSGFCDDKRGSNV